jgi:hypothetical protein
VQVAQQPGDASPTAVATAAPASASAAWPFALVLLPSVLLSIAGLALALGERSRPRGPGEHIFFELFARHEVAGAWMQLALIGLALAPVTFLPARALAGPPSRLPVRPWLIAALLVGLLSLGAVHVYHDHPLSMDEYASWFQAGAFARGRLAGQFPPELLPRLIPAGFVGYFLVPSLETGQVVSAYWPGFALLLAPFRAAGVPWLLNPLLTVGCALLLARLASRWVGGRAAAAWAVLLTLASPVVVVNGISYYAMTAHLFCNLLWMELVTEGRAGDETGVALTGRRVRLLAAGVVGSLALVLHNPVPHAVFALPWMFALLRRRGPGALSWLAAGYLPLSLLLGVGWTRVRDVMGAWMQPEGAPVPFFSRLTATTRGLFAIPDGELLYARGLAAVELAQWAAPFLVALAVLGWTATRRGSPLRLLAGSALLTLLVYCLVPSTQGHGWGYRYFHQVWGALPLLASVALVEPRAAWRRRVLVAAVVSLIAGNALRLYQVERFVAAHLEQLPPAPPEGRAVRFLSPEGGYYVVDLYQNDPFLENRVWTLVSYGEEEDTALVRRLFPGAQLAVTHPHGTVWRVP